jgi:hypothetical protein
MPELIKRKCNIDDKLTEEDLKDIAEAQEDIKAGRTHTTERYIHTSFSTGLFFGPLIAKFVLFLYTPHPSRCHSRS